MNEFFAEEFQTIGHAMVDEMKSRAPVRTGYLRDHIVVQEASAQRLTITSQADYSIYVELGTYKMAARPFFYPVVQGPNGFSKILKDYQSKVKFS